jgi:hypothetical protein
MVAILPNPFESTVAPQVPGGHWHSFVRYMLGFNGVGAVNSFALRCLAVQVDLSDKPASGKVMIICERCGTENLNGSRYCDECGAALWLAGKSGGLSLPGAKNNGSDGNGSKDAAATVAQSTAKASSSLISEQQTSVPLAQSGHRVHATLVIERGNSAGKQFPLSNQDANIGRWDADGGVFPDVDLDSDDPEAKVSRRHARILLREGQYVIEDLGSTNGTFVNRGRRLIPGDRQPLQDGDEIIVGKTFLRFRVAR